MPANINIQLTCTPPRDFNITVTTAAGSFLVALTATQADPIAISFANIGPKGLSAYTIAVMNGFVGTEVEWLLSLKGADGDQGPQGDPGPEGPQGPAGSSYTEDLYEATGSTDLVITLPHVPAAGTKTLVFKNGSLLWSSQYSITGADITLGSREASDEIAILYKY